MDTWKITTLIENLVYAKNLISEHGLSFLIEAEGLKILFDTGQSPNFIKNAQVLDKNMPEVDVCIISHGHYDHAGGLSAFMEVNKKAPVWVGPESFAEKHDRNGNFTGIPAEIDPDDKRIKISSQTTKISENIFILPAAPVYFKEDVHASNMFYTREGVVHQDEFPDEQSLVIIKDSALNIISSCSHRGISNITKFATESFGLPVSKIIGGFHLKNESPGKVDALIENLNTFDIDELWISHCTGVENFYQIKKLFKGKAHYNYTGNIIEL